MSEETERALKELQEYRKLNLVTRLYDEIAKLKAENEKLKNEANEREVILVRLDTALAESCAGQESEQKLIFTLQSLNAEMLAMLRRLEDKGKGYYFGHQLDCELAALIKKAEEQNENC